MTHEEEFEQFVGGDEREEYPAVPCRMCNDYPCRCLVDDDTSEPIPNPVEGRE